MVSAYGVYFHLVRLSVAKEQNLVHENVTVLRRLMAAKVVKEVCVTKKNVSLLIVQVSFDHLILLF